ncbi:MAG TPA: septation protein IspZ, partial [Treponemataceae bacterium]|nr:septation protein IspZ [Treponemataceae bacterium]
MSIDKSIIKYRISLQRLILPGFACHYYRMKNRALLSSFLPGFAPIIVYIAIEAAFGETAGLICGMALGLGEFIWILIRERRVDPFTLVDTVLLAAMGGLSWALSDPIFFRLKPAISEAVLAAIMLIGSLGPHRFFLPYL